MKLMSWILIFCFTSQVFAGSVHEDLTAALNNYEYDMVVEWDQKDQAQADKFNENFAKAVEKLYAQGLTNEDLLIAIEARTPDKAKFEALKARATKLGASVKDPRGLTRILQDQLSDMGQRGASWNGDVTMAVMIIAPMLVVGALIIYQMMWSKSHRCAEAARVESCEEVCDDWTYSENSCDSWGQNCSSGQVCVRSHMECGLVEQCQKWEKIPGK